MKTKINKSENKSNYSNSSFSRSKDSVFFTAQPKLKVGQPNDQYEQEADRVANQVISRQAENQTFFAPAQSSVLQTKPLAETITPLVQKQEEEEEEAQAKRLETVQKQEEEEEEAQPKLLETTIQKQEIPEEEEMLQAQEEEEEVMPKPQQESVWIQQKTENVFNNSFLEREISPLPNISTTGAPVNFIVFGDDGPVSISLHGTTEPNFDGGIGNTTNIRVTPATDCEGCSDDECLNVSGTHTLVFNANPVVTLPSRSEYDHLSPCQIQRVEQWIRDVLAPHEQEHVDAFNTYDGTVQRQFQLKICRSDWGSEALQPFHDKIEAERRQSAQELSDALDPFHTNIDLDCEDEEQHADGPEAVEQQSSDTTIHAE
ncbi:MAG: hypothetical protein ABFS16_00260 [Bacteroidota bacterium]